MCYHPETIASKPKSPSLVESPQDLALLSIVAVLFLYGLVRALPAIPGTLKDEAEEDRKAGKESLLLKITDIIEGIRSKSRKI
ncbi:MAG: hypothetical protein PHU71_02145 [Candidatus Gracilibacteria bacterium]|nr:hypothetical protein [Candidatus Gracilibacteria bacterium]